MFSHFLCGLIFAVIYGSQNAFGTECNSTEINKCIEKFHLFEDKSFPVYGKDEDDLNDVCSVLGLTLQCPLRFRSCEDDDACDDECKRYLIMINTYNTHRLTVFYKELCAGTEPFRTKYLEHASCLYNFSQESHSYEECYNTSMASMEYLFNNPQLVTLGAKCCYISWLRGCYMKVTSNSCGDDAANFVSDAINILKPGAAEQCRSEATCDGPPLPDSPEGKKNDNIPSKVPGFEPTTRKASAGGQRALFNHVLVAFAIAPFMLTFIK